MAGTDLTNRQHNRQQASYDVPSTPGDHRHPGLTRVDTGPMTYHHIRPELEHLTIEIHSIRPNDSNPNNGDVEAVAESLTVNGQYLPIVVDAATRTIIAGHTRWNAALELGWTHIAAVVTATAGEGEAARLMLADNRTGQLAVMDPGLLLAALREQPYLLGTAYRDEDVARLERSVSAPLTFPESKRDDPGCPLCGK